MFLKDYIKMLLFHFTPVNIIKDFGGIFVSHLILKD